MDRQEETHFNLFEHQPGMESAGLMRVCRLQECCLPLFDPDLID